MKFLRQVLLISLVVASLEAEKFSYDNFKLLRIYPKTKENFELINFMESQDKDLDIWNINKNEFIDMLVSPNGLAKYSQTFSMNDISFEILDNNIQKKIENQEKSVVSQARKGESKSIIFKYARYSEIRSFIDTIVLNNPDLASSYDAGKTYENRDLKVIVIKSPNHSGNRAIWIDCGIHAREWVSPSTCVFIIDALIEEYRNNDPGVISLLEKYEFHILPLLNPDGYEYSHTTYRLWRKNRTPNPDSSCIGTDLNRNFDFRWRTGGSSINPCSDTYAGPSGSSELETKAVINAIAKKSGQWDAYLSLHTYGQWWLTPYGDSVTNDKLPPDYADIKAKGEIGAAAIRNFNGTRFIVGSSAQLLYINTGSSKDYFYGKENIKYSYVLELRPGSGTPDASFGFLLPEDRMPLVATETYIGIKAFISAI